MNEERFGAHNNEQERYSTTSQFEDCINDRFGKNAGLMVSKRSTCKHALFRAQWKAYLWYIDFQSWIL